MSDKEPTEDREEWMAWAENRIADLEDMLARVLEGAQSESVQSFERGGLYDEAVKLLPKEDPTP